MSAMNWVTVLLSGFLTILPQIVPLLPAEARDISTAAIGVLVSAWHLHQPAPGSTEGR